MEELADIVGPQPRVVFCGMAGEGSTRSREHHYDTPGNNFWAMLHESGLTPRLLSPAQEDRLPSYGLGLTDLVGRPGPGGRQHDLGELVAKMRLWEPDWLAFTSKTVAHAAARLLGARRPGLGPTDLFVGPAQVFVLPGPSGANRRKDYDGRVDRLSWWRDLAALAPPQDPGPARHAGS